MFLVSMPSKFPALFNSTRITQTKVIRWLNPILNNLWVLVLTFIFISCVFTYHSLQEAEKRIRNQVVESLQTVLQTTHGSIFQVWYRGRVLSALNWAKYKQGQTGQALYHLNQFIDHALPINSSVVLFGHSQA